MNSQEELLDDVFDNEVKDEDFAIGVVGNSEPQTPNRGDEGWTEYVLGMLRENEIYQERPKADGLARLVEKLIDYKPMFDVKVHASDRTYASCTVYLSLNNGASFIGSAECSELNTKPPFCNFPLATAETRAIGRACKKALGLVGITTAEEISGATFTLVNNTDEKKREDGMVTDSQINFIERLCKKTGTNVQEIVKNICGEDIKYINEIGHQDAVIINGILDDLQRTMVKDKNHKSQFGEYDPSWKTNFLRGK